MTLVQVKQLTDKIYRTLGMPVKRKQPRETTVEPTLRTSAPPKKNRRELFTTEEVIEDIENDRPVVAGLVPLEIAPMGTKSFSPPPRRVAVHLLLLRMIWRMKFITPGRMRTTCWVEEA